MRIFWKQFLKIKGWSVPYPFPRDVPKALVIVGPHSSNWDFVNGLAVRSVERLTHVRYLGKAELFKGPFGFIFKSLGGTPLHRGQGGQVESVVEMIKNHEGDLLIAMAPEGTRKRVDRLKTGFYHIAKRANLPLILAAIDYRKREFVFGEVMKLTDDMDADMEKITQWFAQFQGFNPDQDLYHLAHPQGSDSTNED